MHNGISGGITGEAERAARCRKMGVHEEVLESGIGEVFLDSSPHAGSRSSRPRFPGSARTIGALRKPASRRRSTEDAPMLRDPYRKLEPDTLVPREQRQVTVGGGRANDLDLARRLQGAERRDEVSSD